MLTIAIKNVNDVMKVVSVLMLGLMHPNFIGNVSSLNVDGKRR